MTDVQTDVVPMAVGWWQHPTQTHVAQYKSPDGDWYPRTSPERDTDEFHRDWVRLIPAGSGE